MEKINKLGEIGQTIKVKPGYARNFLFPNKMAIRATAENKEIFEKQKSQLEKVNLEKKKLAEGLVNEVPNSITIFREASEQGALFGSVTSRDIVNEINSNTKLNLKAKDLTIKQIIKSVGEFKGNLSLHPEVTKDLVIVVKSSEK